MIHQSILSTSWKMPVHLLDVLFLAQYYIYISDISNRYCLQKVLPEVGLTTLQSGCVACAYPGKSCCMLTLCWPLQLWIWYLCVDVHLYGVSQSEVLGWFYNPNTTPKRQRESSGLPAWNWTGVALKGVLHQGDWCSKRAEVPLACRGEEGWLE